MRKAVFMPRAIHLLKKKRPEKALDFHVWLTVEALGKQEVKAKTKL